MPHFTIILPELTDVVTGELKIYDGFDQLWRMVEHYKMAAPLAIRVIDNRARCVRTIRVNHHPTTGWQLADDTPSVKQAPDGSHRPGPRPWRIAAFDPRHFQRSLRHHSNRTVALRLVDNTPRVRCSSGPLYSRALGHQGRSHAHLAPRLGFRALSLERLDGSAERGTHFLDSDSSAGRVVEVSACRSLSKLKVSCEISSPLALGRSGAYAVIAQGVCGGPRDTLSRHAPLSA
jgi:hypothetical protein